MALALTVIFFRLGPMVLATQSVLLVSSSTTFQAPFALGVATSVRYSSVLPVSFISADLIFLLE